MGASGIGHGDCWVVGVYTSSTMGGTIWQRPAIWQGMRPAQFYEMDMRYKVTVTLDPFPICPGGSGGQSGPQRFPWKRLSVSSHTS
jgi:hypothetical protein